MVITKRYVHYMPEPMDARRLRFLTIVLAVACGLTVANLYYAQPLLAPIADTFGVSEGTSALVVTVTQLGYAVGLALLLPLGDLLENRALASRLLLLTAAALAGLAFAPSFGTFVALAALVGLTSVVAQILIPLAAHLAPAGQAGAFVGKVMSGLLLGILLARTVSSLIAAQFGWQTVYVASAVLMLAVSLALSRALPRRVPTDPAPYGTLLRSIVTIAREEPALRRRTATQALMFGAFTSFWTAIAFELTDHHGLTQAGVGVFALVGAAGALAAPVAGRIGDRGHGALASGIALAVAAGALILAATTASSLVLLAVAAVALDLAVQGHQVLSQQEIYALRPAARARINTAFMSTIFLSGAVCSALSGVLYDAGGWTAVALFAAALPAVAFGIWARANAAVSDESRRAAQAG
jgi:predicted MFS family arabinose efflux permease